MIKGTHIDHTNTALKPGDILISRTLIDQRITELAQSISVDYLHKKLIIAGIMKGSLLFMSDLMKKLYDHGCTDFCYTTLMVKSYGSHMVSHQKPKVIQDVDLDLKDRHVLLIEDIVDRGHTLHDVIKHVQSHSPASIRSCTLLSKPDRRELTIEADYTGFVIPDIWVQGYGMDTDEWGRGQPDIIVGPVTF